MESQLGMSINRILIIDTDRAFANVLAIRCQRLNLRVTHTVDSQNAVSLMRSDPPSLILLADVEAVDENGQSLAERLATDRKLEGIPVIVLANESDRYTIHRCQELGHVYFHKSLDMWERLIPVIARILSMPTTQPTARRRFASLRMYGKVLCVDEDPRITRSLQLQLREHGIDCVREINGVDGFNAAVRYSPEAIITEFTLSEGLGSYMLGRLRDCEIEIPVIFLTNIGEEMYPGLQQHLMDLGASAVLRKPFKIESILVELRKHINLPAEIFPDQQSDVNVPEKPGGHEISPHFPIGGRKSARERTQRPATSDERVDRVEGIGPN